MTAPNHTGEGGFSLIEALAALMVVSVALIPLFQMQNGLFDASRRAQAQATRLEAMSDVVTWLDMLNPMVTPRGEQVFGNTRLEWRAEELARVRRNDKLDGTLETIAHFSVDITLYHEDGHRLLDETIYLNGWSNTANERQ